MTLKPLAVRIPEEVERKIREIIEAEGLDKARVVRGLLELGIAEWRRQRALEMLRDAKATFAKAAEIAGLSLWDFADLVRRRGVEWVRFSVEDVERELKEASEEYP